jgi:O6-methylguanine-DNA--protein-cysteine methyltransferase
VIGVNGKLTGYAGGIELKDKLLAWERALKGGPGVSAC